MAKLQEESLVITVSRMVKNADQNPELLFTAETIISIQDVIKELVGKDVLIEIEKP